MFVLIGSNPHLETDVFDYFHSAEMTYVHHDHFNRLFSLHLRPLFTCSELNLHDGARCGYKICDMTGKPLYQHFTQTGWEINTSHCQTLVSSGCSMLCYFGVYFKVMWTFNIQFQV